MEHTEYLKRREELIKIRTDSFISFDKAVLSLATGGLALSITFLDKIGSPFSAATYILIFLTWLSFLVVILANLLSYHFAKANMWEKIRELDDKYKQELNQAQPALIDPPVKPAIAEPAVEPETEKQFWQRRATEICNSAAVYVFVAGVVFFTAYVIQIQRYNYARMVLQKPKEESVMSLDRKAGLTEVTAPIAKPASLGPLNNGLTEAPAAVSRQAVPNHPPSMQLERRGQTEVPQAVAAPTKPTVAPAQPSTPAQPPVASPAKPQNTGG